ncbi:MAG: ABC transporter permease [Verrucomicrobia subdivision 3 bacterium]|nr:ABC transporter permease [Limisphaerales bacterium]
MKLFRGFNAILYKEFIVVLRDPMTLFFMLFPPLIEMIAFGYALDNDVKHMATYVFDEDRTAESRLLIDQFVNTQTFRVVGEAQSAEGLADAIRQGKAYVGIQIPPDFTRNLRVGHSAQVQVLINGSSSTIASSALNTSISVGLRQSLLGLLGQSGRRDLPVEIRPQVLYNPDMRSPNFFVPGVIGVVLQIATTFATAMSIVRERERGTIEQLLVSPVSRWGLMLGKITPYLCIGLIMAAGLFAIMRWLFEVPIAGSAWALALSSFLYIFSLLSLGLLVSTAAENQMQALQMTMIFIMPSVFFSGFIFPRETMPWIFYAIGALLPTTYFIELLRGIILRGATLADFWRELVILTGMGVALFGICAARFRSRIR